MKTSASPLSFLMLLSRLVPSSCASMNVHSIVGYRAYKYYGGVYPSATVDAEHADAFTRVIHDNLDAVLGGSDFPDFCTRVRLVHTRTTTMPARLRTGHRFTPRPSRTSLSRGGST